ncbi:hypothetical protein [Hymenobacter psychrophilus]|uniref:Heavy-metal-associated domain-containing protein n=1 Tax=Hymenobacter psychrophilus TaxID=651662 RepID=A0A1H3HVY7_9BACT|nr:hypothetical protein [Hymenobacter psychrophilus]SDY19637.1 hypothetical protein SAMN04488069_106175 [Hymenobacter psychrophilus]
MTTRHFRWAKAKLAGALVLLTLIGWGSWQEPSLHEFTPTTEFITLAAPGLQPGAAARQLQARALALPGVTACALRPEKHLLTLAYHSAELSAEELQQRLALSPLPQSEATAAEAARQCPVPPSYLQAIERVRFAFNLRRLFVQL